MTQEKKKISKIYLSKRSLARLLATQAIYQSEQTQEPIDKIVKDFLSMTSFKTLFGDGEDIELSENIPNIVPDWNLFETIVKGVNQEQETLDNHIKEHLQGWSLERLDSVLKSILRAGFFEILHMEETPAPVVINEYVEIAKGFFVPKEVSFVNASLDRFSKKIRVEEQ